MVSFLYDPGQQKKSTVEILAVKLELIRELAQLQPLDCMIAVSHYSENLSDIQQMKKEVLKCLEYGKKIRDVRLLSYQDLPMEYKENDFRCCRAITELIRYLRSGNEKIFEQMQKIINETEKKETEKYFNNIMELMGYQYIFISFRIPLDKESKNKITESFEQQIHVQSERKDKKQTAYEILKTEYITDNIQSMHNDQNQLIQQIYKYLNDNFYNQSV